MNWLQKEGVFTCPKCGYSFEHEGYTQFFNFCPCCGIVMNERSAKPQTNADVIRRMNDDQLFDFIRDIEDGEIDYAITFCDMCKEGGNSLNLDCDGCLKHWLSRDATEVFGLLYQAGGNTLQNDREGSADNENCPDKS